MRYVYLKPGQSVIVKGSGRTKSQRIQIKCDREGVLENWFLGSQYNGVENENNSNE